MKNRKNHFELWQTQKTWIPGEWSAKILRIDPWIELTWLWDEFEWTFLEAVSEANLVYFFEAFCFVFFMMLKENVFNFVKCLIIWNFRHNFIYEMRAEFWICTFAWNLNNEFNFTKYFMIGNTRQDFVDESNLDFFFFFFFWKCFGIFFLNLMLWKTMFGFSLILKWHEMMINVELHFWSWSEASLEGIPGRNFIWMNFGNNIPHKAKFISAY